MKFSYIVIIIVAVIAGLAGYLLFFRSQNANQNPGNGSPSTASQPSVIVPLDPAIIPAGEKIVFGTSSNGAVTVNNFYKIAKGYDGDALVIRNAAEYQIIYVGENSAFGIYIIGGSVESSRKAAEEDLLAILGISQAETCLLKVSWSVSPAIAQNLSGHNYPLSFCPGSL
jgi:hypothetical protein